MTTKLDIKILKLAAQICGMHKSIASDRTCQDWSDDTTILDSLTPDERDWLMEKFEQCNSDGQDFEPGYFPYDEMMISYVVEQALLAMAGREEMHRLIAEMSAAGEFDRLELDK